MDTRERDSSFLSSCSEETRLTAVRVPSGPQPPV